MSYEDLDRAIDASPMKDTLQKFRDNGGFLHLEDGFMYFWADKPGAYSQEILYEIALVLNAANFLYEEELEAFFERERQKGTGDENDEADPEF